MIKKSLILIYGIMSYLLFSGVFIYFIGFVGNFIVPKSVDSGTMGLFTTTSWVTALLVNTLLMGLFGIQHSLMARPQFKQKWIKIVPIPIERSTYVLFASLTLMILCLFWQPLPHIVWQVESVMIYYLLWGLFGFGWLLSFFATFLISHYDLVGLRQVYLYWRGEPYTSVDFKIASLYRYVRHPIMLGTLIGLWATPTMRVGHLMLAIGFSLYIFIGIYLEEKDMLSTQDESYRKYRYKTSMIMPLPSRRKNADIIG